MSNPLYYAPDYTMDRLWPVFKSPVRSATGVTMGGPVAFCDTAENAKELAGILLAADDDQPYKLVSIFEHGPQIGHMATRELALREYNDRLNRTGPDTPLALFLYCTGKEFAPDQPDYHKEKWVLFQHVDLRG